MKKKQRRTAAVGSLDAVVPRRYLVVILLSLLYIAFMGIYTLHQRLENFPLPRQNGDIARTFRTARTGIEDARRAAPDAAGPLAGTSEQLRTLELVFEDMNREIEPVDRGLAYISGIAVMAALLTAYLLIRSIVRGGGSGGGGRGGNDPVPLK